MTELHHVPETSAHAEPPGFVQRYLTLPVRIATLLILAAAIALYFVPADLRDEVLLNGAWFLGAFLPGWAIAAVIGWLTFNKKHFVNALLVATLLTVLVLVVGPMIAEDFGHR